MRRSASEIIRNLEIRVARLERSARPLKQPNTLIRANKKGLINATLKREVALEAFNELAEIPETVINLLIKKIEKNNYDPVSIGLGRYDRRPDPRPSLLKKIDVEEFFICEIRPSKKMGSDWMELNLFFDPKIFDRRLQSIGDLVAESFYGEEYTVSMGNIEGGKVLNDIANKVLTKVFSRLQVVGVKGHYNLNNMKVHNQDYRLARLERQAKSKTRMFDEVGENLDEHIDRLYKVVRDFGGHELLKRDRQLMRKFEEASEMLRSLQADDVLGPYKDFLDRFNKVEAMLMEVKTRCLFA